MDVTWVMPIALGLTTTAAFAVGGHFFLLWISRSSRLDAPMNIMDPVDPPEGFF